MNSRLKQGSSHCYTITLGVVSEDPQDSDPALVDAVGRDITDALSKNGFTIEPIYMGQRGGFLVNVLIPFLAATWTSKDIILADSSALVTLMAPVFTLVQHLREVHEKRVGKEAFQQAPIKISVKVSGASISVEAPDLETAEGAMNLALHFQAEHPTVASRVTSQSNVQVTGSVPKRPPRKRR